MLTEVSELAQVIGVMISSTEDKTMNVGIAADVRSRFDELVEVLEVKPRPDAERAALILLSAGAMLYGNTHNEADEYASAAWTDALTEAEKLLGIVPLTPAN